MLQAAQATQTAQEAAEAARTARAARVAQKLSAHIDPTLGILVHSEYSTSTYYVPEVTRTTKHVALQRGSLVEINNADGKVISILPVHTLRYINLEAEREALAASTLTPVDATEQPAITEEHV